MAVLDGQFPTVSPAGDYIACGAVRLTVARIASVDAGTQIVTLDNVTDVGEGNFPHWYNPGGAPAEQVLYYNRAAALMAVPTPAPFVAQFHAASGAVNTLGAGGGVWQYFINDGSGSRMFFSDGAVLSGRLDVPAGVCVDQNGRGVFLSDATTTLYQRTAAGAVSVVDAGPVLFRPHVSTQGIVWHRTEGGRFVTYGNRGSGIERIHVTAGSEFWAIPIDTPAGPWILAHDANTLYLRAWGQPTVRTVASGTTWGLHAHAVYSSARGGFLVAWVALNGELELRFIALDVTAVEQPTAPNPIPGGGGSGPGPGGSFPPPAGLLTVTPAKKFVPQRHRVYPHVAEVTDKPAQQTIKLLWDKVQELQERIEIGDVAQRFAAVEASVGSTNVRIDEQEDQLESNPAEALETQIPGGGGSPGGGGPGDGGGGGGGGGGGTSGSCADSPGTGHYDPGGPLSNERARKIVCGTGDEWSNLRVPTATLAERESNAEQLVLRMIWHLAQGGFTAGRQRNPSTAISKDKLAVVIGGETRAFDVFFDYDTFGNALRVKWDEVFPADLVADAGIAD